jgi:uncharacterized coiled-coil protein SlyX
MATLRERVTALEEELSDKDDYIQELEDRLAEISGLAIIEEEGDPTEDDEGEG